MLGWPLRWWRMEISRRTSSMSSLLTSFHLEIALHAASAPVCLFVTR